MDDLQRLATEMARRYLAVHQEKTSEDSRLFADLKALAAGALETVRSWEFGPEIAPAMQPVHK